MSEVLSELGVVRQLVLAVVLVGLIVAESILPEVRSLVGGQRWRHDGRNLTLAAINGILGVVLLVPALAALAITVEANNWGLWPLLGGGIGAWVATLLLFDLWMYVWHRLNHEVPLLWRLHRVHHSDLAMDASTALRFHPVEILLSGLSRAALMPILGIGLEQILVYEIILLPVILVQHANIHSPKRFDWLMRLVLVTPWMHRIHHSRLRRETNSNYGSVLSVWDRLFGSWRWRRDPEAIVFGLEHWREDDSQSVVGMLRTPLDPNPQDDQTKD